MKPRLIFIFALLLPLAGLAALWGWSEAESRQGSEWDVPVQGYDPRDLLRGHYVQFQYVWPGLGEDVHEPIELCLHGTAPTVLRVTLPKDGQACPHSVRADSWSGEFGWLSGGRLFVPQEEGIRMQNSLTDPKLQGVLRFRLRPDGHITPLRLTFRPRLPTAREQ